MFATPAAVGLVAVSWFFFTSFFYESSTAQYKAAVEEFFTRLKTPLQKAPDQVTREDTSIVFSIGNLSIIYGSFVVLSVLIPNSLGGRFCFVCCGGIMVAVGLFVRWFYKRLDEKSLSQSEAARLSPLAERSRSGAPVP
jgi:hypothetical protein